MVFGNPVPLFEDLLVCNEVLSSTAMIASCLLVCVLIHNLLETNSITAIVIRMYQLLHEFDNSYCKCSFFFISSDSGVLYAEL